MEMRRLGHQLEPVAAVAREGDRSGSSSPRRTTRSCIFWRNELGFDDKLFQLHRRRERRSRRRGHAARDQSGCWTIGYTGQSPERLKLHMAEPGQVRRHDAARHGGARSKGDTYGLPWPCWGTPELKHPGTHILYDTSKPVAEGGLPFRARWGVEHEGENLLAEDSYHRRVGDRGRLSRDHDGGAGGARLGGRAEPRGEAGHRAIAAGQFIARLLEVDEKKASDAERGEVERAALRGQAEPGRQ